MLEYENRLILPRVRDSSLDHRLRLGKIGLGESETSIRAPHKGDEMIASDHLILHGALITENLFKFGDTLCLKGSPVVVARGNDQLGPRIHIGIQRVLRRVKLHSLSVIGNISAKGNGVQLAVAVGTALGIGGHLTDHLRQTVGLGVISILDVDVGSRHKAQNGIKGLFLLHGLGGFHLGLGLLSALNGILVLFGSARAQKKGA